MYPDNTSFRQVRQGSESGTVTDYPPIPPKTPIRYPSNEPSRPETEEAGGGHRVKNVEYTDSTARDSEKTRREL